MTTGEMLTALIKRCKAEFSLEVNDHKTYYTQIFEALESLESCGFEIDKETKAKIIENDSLVQIRAYINTPVGYIGSIHWDVEEAIKETYLEAVRAGYIVPEADDSFKDVDLMSSP